jgi:hypothetical protein
VPLTGQEWLLKQNSPLDATPLPKEELVPTQLICDYILNHLTELSYDTGILTLHLDNFVDLTYDLSSIGVVSNMVLSGTDLVITKDDGTVVTINLGTLVIKKNIISLNVDENLVLSFNRLNFPAITVSLQTLDKTIVSGEIVGSELRLTKADSSVATWNIAPLLTNIKISQLTLLNPTLTLSAGLAGNRSVNLKELSYFLYNIEIIPATQRYTNSDFDINLYTVKFPPSMYGRFIVGVLLYANNMTDYLTLTSYIDTTIETDTTTLVTSATDLYMNYNDGIGIPITSSSYINISMQNAYSVPENKMPFGMYLTLLITK